MKIEGWRRKIDAIDTKLLHLLNSRAELSLQVGMLKCQEGMSFRSPAREREIITRMKKANPGPFDGAAVAKIYRLIVAESIRMQELHCRAPRGRAAERRGTRKSS